MALDVKGQALDLAVIGNCRTAALLDTGGRIVWWCFPRFDSDPAFSRLLAGNEEKGFCDVALEGAVADGGGLHPQHGASSRRSSATLRATRCASPISRPRFRRFERVFNPPQIFRRIEPVAGLPRIKIRVRPTFNYGQPCASRALGSNHIRFSGGVDTLRLTTDAPLSYIAHEAPFALIKPVTLILGPDEPFEAAVETASREFLERTRRLLARLGTVAGRSAGVPGRRHPRRDHAQAVQLRGDGRHHRRPHHLHPRGARHDSATGTTATAGCATPSSSSRR